MDEQPRRSSSRENVGKVSGLVAAARATVGDGSQWTEANEGETSKAEDRRGRRSIIECSRASGKAFVLQLSRDTGPTLQPFTGRVEHLATGRRVRFATFEDFQQAVIRLLSEAQMRDPVGREE